MPYSRFSVDKLILRDHLALDRTVLANERTLLSYVRTAIMLLASGVTLVKLFPDQTTMYVLGYALIPGALGVGVLGLLRYRAIRCRIGQIGAVVSSQPVDIPILITETEDRED